MGPAGALARAWLRRNVAATISLVLLVALASGATAAAFAAERRAASALDRFLDHNRPADLQVYGEGLDLAAIRALPGVVGSAEGAYGLMTVEGPGGGPFPPGVINPFITSAVDGERMFRPYVVDGTEPDPESSDQVAIDEDAARRLGAGVGDVLRLQFFLPEQIDELYEAGGDFPVARGDRTEATVTAVVRHPFDLNPTKPDDVDAVSLASADIHFPEGFWAAHAGRLAAFGGDGDGIELLLGDAPAGVADVEAAIRAMPGGTEAAVERRNDSIEAIFDVRQTVRFEGVALIVFAMLTALVGTVVVGQAVARQLRAELAQRTVLSGIGLTRRDIGLAATLRMAPVAILGPLGGAVLAWGSSRWTPIGFGRRAETDPGPWFDAPVLLGGAALAAAATVAWATWTGWRTTAVADRAGVGFGGRMATMAAGAGAPVPVVAGLAQLTGRTRSGRTPLRSSLAAVAFALASVVAVAVFSTSMERFLDVPAEHGWAWDLVAGDSDDERLATEGPEMLAANDHVAGFASVWSGYENLVSIDGVDPELGIIGIDSLAGGTHVAIRDGRAPESPDEIVLGERTTIDAGIDIGDEVTLDGPTESATYRVVGTAVLHELVGNGFELDEGAVVTSSGLGRLFGSGDGARVGDVDFAGGVRVTRFLVDVADGVDLADATASIRSDFGPTIVPHVRPLDVASLDGTRSLPVIFGAVVSVLGATSLVHLLLVTVHRRRREFAVLATLGARRRQLAATVVSLATALVVVALAVGVPAGLIAGRVGWLTLASGIGAPTAPIVPVVWLLLAVAVIAVVANIIAAAPARLARRVRPAEILRSE